MRVNRLAWKPRPVASLFFWTMGTDGRVQELRAPQVCPTNGPGAIAITLDAQELELISRVLGQHQPALYSPLWGVWARLRGKVGNAQAEL